MQTVTFVNYVRGNLSRAACSAVKQSLAATMEGTNEIFVLAKVMNAGVTGRITNQEMAGMRQ